MKKFRVGVEILDESKQPVEHLDYWDFEDFNEACDYYRTIKINKDTAKYLMLRTDEDEEVLIDDGYYVTCPLCEENMRHHMHNGTHIWVCETCPHISFEYNNDMDLYNLQEFIKERNNYESK